MATSTYIVKAQYGRFIIDNSSFLAIFIPAGGSAIFDQSDSSNTGHPIKISTTRDGTHAGGSEYTTGVVVTGTAGSAGAKVQFAPETDGIYYYYCGNHPNMGSSISFIKTVFTDLGATAYDADEGDLTTSIKEVYKGSDLLATITSPHVNPWEVANISLPATEGASYTIKYNVTDASGAVAQEYIRNININTTVAFAAARPLTIGEYITAKLGYDGWTIDSMVTWDDETKTSATEGYSLDAYARTGVPGREIPLYIYPPSIMSNSNMSALVGSMGYGGVIWKYINYTLNGTSGQIEVDQYFPMFEGTLQTVSNPSSMNWVDYINARLGGYEHWDAEALQYRSDDTWYEQQYPYDKVGVGASVLPMNKGYSSSGGTEVAVYDPEVNHYVRHGGYLFYLEANGGKPFDVDSSSWKTVRVLVPYPLEIPIEV